MFSINIIVLHQKNIQYHISNIHLADREVKSILKSRSGDILALCNTNEDWAPRSKSSAISDIERGDHTYFIQIENQRFNIFVENSLTGKNLSTGNFLSEDNMLLNLPDEVIYNKRVHFER